MSDENLTMPLEPQWSEIREGVRAVCEQFPNDYFV